MSTEVRKIIPLPATRSEWEEKLRSNLTLADRVGRLIPKAVELKGFLDLLRATGDDDSVEGTIKDDWGQAAKMIRDLAIKEDDPVVSKAKIATLRRAIGTNLRKAKLSPKQRAYTIDGQVLLEDHTSDEDATSNEMNE